jgi:hypothetical protein
MGRVCRAATRVARRCGRVDDRLVLGRVACGGADVLVLLEDDSDGEERVKVTSVVDCEFAAPVNGRWVSHFLRCSSSALPDGADHE